jgi:hypothetical protein
LIYLDPGRITMVPHAYLPKAISSQMVLRCLNGLEYLRRDPCAVGDTGGKAGKRGFVPDRQRKSAGEFPDL